MSWLCSWCHRFFSHIIGNISCSQQAQAPLVSSPTCTLHSHHHSQSHSQHHHHHKCTRHCTSFKNHSPLSATKSTATNNATNASAGAGAVTTTTDTTTIQQKQSKSIEQKKQYHLLDLPHDLLLEIVGHVTHCRHDSPSYPPHRVVEPRTYTQALSLAYTSKATQSLFYHSLDDISLASISISDQAISSLSLNINSHLKRLVLRNAGSSITNQSLISIGKHCTNLKSLDLSFLNGIDVVGLKSLCISECGKHLKSLLLRKCPNIGDKSLIHAISIPISHKLETLDISYCLQITDAGITGLFSKMSTRSTSTTSCNLKLLAMANIIHLSDKSMRILGTYCKQLIQLCIRGLPLITDKGFQFLSQGSGQCLEGVDITLCHNLTRSNTLKSLAKYCLNIHIMPKFVHDRSLRQIIISSLRQNIFIVHGSDPESGMDTVHTVLIDNGDLVSASLLSSGTTDLSMLGIVLCKSYGSTLNEETKQMLEDDYGIPVTALTD